jgi:hypothetical protein
MREKGVRNLFLFGKNFTATGSLTISGTITSGGNGLPGVTVSAGGKSATTAANGTYTITQLPPGTHTVAPSKTGYTFTPVSRSVPLTDANATGQDFTGTTP